MRKACVFSFMHKHIERPHQCRKNKIPSLKTTIIKINQKYKPNRHDLYLFGKTALI